MSPAARLEMLSASPDALDAARWSAWAARDASAGGYGLALGGGAHDAVLADAMARLAEAQETIVQQQERIAYLESLTMTDELTGLLNRRGFYALLRRELAAARRNAAATGVLVMIDLDGFKAVNDTYGHLAGDAFLRQVARLLSSLVRQHDVVGRLGGDEFAVLMTGTDPCTGTGRARQLAAAGNRATVSWGGHILPVRFSIGIKPFSGADHEDDLIRQADVAMYGEKSRRKRVRPAA